MFQREITSIDSFEPLIEDYEFGDNNYDIDEHNINYINPTTYSYGDAGIKTKINNNYKNIINNNNCNNNYTNNNSVTIKNDQKSVDTYSSKTKEIYIGTDDTNDDIMSTRTPAVTQDLQRIWKCIFNQLTEKQSHIKRTHTRRVKEGRAMKSCDKDLRCVLSMLKHFDEYIYSCYSKIWSRAKLTEDEKLHVAQFIKNIMDTDAASAFCISNFQTLLRRYPQFQYASADEQLHLLRFCNSMRISSRLMKGTLNKDLLLCLCAIVEGQQMRYVTGSGMTTQTANRVSIFHKEFGVVPVSRANRRR